MKTALEHINKNWTYKLTKLKLHKNGEEYYLEAEYETDCKKEKGILTIPRIPLHIADVPNINIYSECNMLFYGSNRKCEVDLGFGNIELHSSDSKDNPWFTYKVTEEKVEELTLEEIEQKLGHKVKIVSEKK